jgi:uncharacterized protein YPO0396
VVEWINKNHLGLRLVYYRVQTGSTYTSASYAANANTVYEKIDIKADTSFGPWLSKELRTRFPYVCCDSLQQFRNESQAITKEGHIKHSGNRHEKDDRYSINDRRKYILGFSNIGKIKALEEDEHALRMNLDLCQRLIKDYDSQQAQSQQRIITMGHLEVISDFSEIDTISRERDLKDKEERKQKLEQENDILKGLQRQLDNLEQQKKDKEDDVEKALTATVSLENQLNEFNRRKEQLRSIFSEGAVEMYMEAYPFLERHMAEAVHTNTPSLENVDKLRRQFSKWLLEGRDRREKISNDLSSSIAAGLTGFKNRYFTETKDLDSTVNSLSEFEKMLNQLKRDGLPQYEIRFKDLLRRNTLHQIALFQSKLKIEETIIKTRIEQINGSLNAIDYNEGRYIRLEYEENSENVIKQFRMDLKACTDGALTGTLDNQYAEEKFLQVKAIIDRFKGRPGQTDADMRWTKMVTDVRNWYLFFASERWRESDEEYEFYKDSGGKSGGH